MIRTRPTLAVAALLCAALVAGCGSSSSTTTTSTAATAASTPVTSAPSSPSPTVTSSTSPTTKPSNPATAAGVAQYAAICKSIIAGAPTLSASVKAKVEGICSKAASGDLAGARAAAKEVCAEVINASPIPSADKEKALAGCKTT